MPKIQKNIIKIGFGFIALMSILSLFLSPVRAAIFEPTDVPAGSNELKTGVGTLHDALVTTGIVKDQFITDVVFKYVNFALPYLALLVFVGFVYAGFLYVANFGVEDQLTKAKRILVWSIVGLLVVIVSYMVVNLFAKELVEAIK